MEQRHVHVHMVCMFQAKRRSSSTRYACTFFKLLWFDDNFFPSRLRREKPIYQMGIESVPALQHVAVAVVVVLLCSNCTQWGTALAPVWQRHSPPADSRKPEEKKERKKGFKYHYVYVHASIESHPKGAGGSSGHIPKKKEHACYGLRKKEAPRVSATLGASIAVVLLCATLYICAVSSAYVMHG